MGRVLAADAAVDAPARAAGGGSSAVLAGFRAHRKTPGQNVAGARRPRPFAGVAVPQPDLSGPFAAGAFGPRIHGTSTAMRPATLAAAKVAAFNEAGAEAPETLPARKQTARASPALQ